MSIKTTEIGSCTPAGGKRQIVYKGEVIIHAIPMHCKSKRKHCEISNAGPSEKIEQGFMWQASNVAISYVIETPPQRGKFLVDRAIALGVPKGRMFGQLHQGKSVELSNGQIVHSHDCVSPSLPGAVCLLISCPTFDYIDELVSWEGWNIFQNGEKVVAEEKRNVRVIYHLAEENILSDARYVKWLQKFGDDVDHVILNHFACPNMSVFRASTQLQSQLHAEFPLLIPSNDYERKSIESGEEWTTWMQASNWQRFRSVILGESLLQYTLSPVSQRGFHRGNCLQLIQKPEIPDSGISNPKLDISIPRIIFLGTGCAIPSKFRNVSGIYLLLHGIDAQCGGLLLDCGEGSLGQLYRAVGGNHPMLAQVVSQLQCIWISHNHADHHLGILRILCQRSHVGYNEPLLIIGPTQIRYWLEEYCQIDRSIQSSYRFVDNRVFNPNDSNFDPNHNTRRETLRFLYEKLSLASFLTVPVKHAHLSYAVVFQYAGSLTIDSKEANNQIHKIAYSGDCRPSVDLVSAATDAYLFIHEATFDDTLEKEAKDKSHSTFSEAIQVARNARARHVILTHFSQRYPTMSVSNSDAISILAAFDLLTLPLGELRQDHLLETCRKFLE